MNVTDAEFGVKLSEVYKHFCRPDIRDEFLRAGTVAGWNTRHARIRIGGLTPAQTQRKAEVDAYKVADSMVLRDIFSKLHDGRLVATGFVVGQQGRDPDESRRRIPADVLRSPNRRVEWGAEKISGNGLTFVDVRLCPTFEVPGAEKTLTGLSLGECFKKVVTEDWLRREMEEPISRQFPNWKVDVEHFRFQIWDRWPVRFEEWPNPTNSITLLISMSAASGISEPVPIPDVVAARERVEDQVRRLIMWLREGMLVAEGTKEPPDHTLTRQLIARDWWSRAEVEMDITASALRTGPAEDKPVFFSDIRIVSPRSTHQGPVDIGLEDSTRTKGRPGRKPKWDWTGARREIVSLADSPNGLPYPQSAIEDHLKNWFIENYDDHPSESAIRKEVSDHLPPGYHQDS